MIDGDAIDLRFKKFYRDLQQLELFSGKTAGQLLWKYSTRFAAALVAKTRPRGMGDKSALERGEGAVQRDIRKVYPSPGSVWQEIKKESGEGGADRFWALYRAGKTVELHQLLRAIGYDCDVIAWDGGTRHRGAMTKLIKSGKHQPRRSLIIDDRNVKSYIAKVQQHVMWAKAGWVSNFNPPGGVGKGGWPDSVKRHRSAPGRVRDLTKAPGVKKAIIFENNVHYIAYLFSWKMAESTVTHIGKIMGKDLQKAIVQYSKG